MGEKLTRAYFLLGPSLGRGSPCPRDWRRRGLAGLLKTRAGAAGAGGAVEAPGDDGGGGGDDDDDDEEAEKPPAW